MKKKWAEYFFQRVKYCSKDYEEFYIFYFTDHIADSNFWIPLLKLLEIFVEFHIFLTTKTFLSWTTLAVWPTFWPLQLCWCYLKFSISNHCFYLLKKAKTQILSLKFIPMYISFFIVCIEFYQKSFAEANIDKSSSLATEEL